MNKEEKEKALKKDQFLDEVKKRYPIGSEFICVRTGNRNTVKGYAHYENDGSNISHVFANGYSQGGGLLYFKGRWAATNNQFLIYN